MAEPLGASSLRPITTLDEAAWRAFLEASPQANIFLTPEMYQVFQQTRYYTPEVWAVQDRDHTIVALMMPVVISLGDRFLSWLTSRAVAYGGIAYLPSCKEASLSVLVQAYGRARHFPALFTEIRHLSDATDIQPILQCYGFQYEDHLNFLIPLDRPPEVIFQRFKKRVRKQIRRSLREGQVTVEEVVDRSQLPTWYALLRKTYEAAQVPLAPFSLFEAIFEILVPKEMAKFFVAKVGEAWASVSLELLYRDVIYGWYGGTDRAFARYYPTELLLWHIFQWGATHNYRSYDFGGAGRPGEPYGVRDFKAKFGGTLVCFGRNPLVHSPHRLFLSRQGYFLYRKLKRLRHAFSQWSEARAR